MKRFILFVEGTYRKRDLPFYLSNCRGKATIAVDGGYAFFRRSGMVPDVLLGDFDSLSRVPRGLEKTTEVIRFPTAKDKTDVHLALEYALRHGAGQIDIAVPDVGDIDHFLGNVLLLGHTSLCGGGRGKLRVRVVNAAYEIHLANDESITFRDCRRDLVSVLALSSRAILNTRGTEYTARDVRIGLGDSRGLRNRITARRAVITVKGKALVYRRFTK